MKKVSTAANGQLYWNDMDGSTLVRKVGYPISQLRYRIINEGTYKVALVSSLTDGEVIRWTNNVNDTDNNQNSLNTYTAIDTIISELQAAFDIDNGGGGGGGATEATALAILAEVTPDGVHTEATVSVNSSGSVTAGKYAVTFELSEDFTGSIGGVAYSGQATESKEFTADSKRTLPAIAYVVTTGSLKITTLI